MAAPINPLKAALARGTLQTGIWLSTGSALVAEIAGRTGVDWCAIDGEHGPNDLTTILAQLQALAATPAHAVVRVASDDPARIKQVLDLGAQSILVPMIHDGPRAAAAVAAMHYPPRGIRGMGSGVARSGQWGGVRDYLTTAGDQIACLVQAESAAALANIDAIAATPGVDSVFIGPSDLAADMGHPGRSGHPEVRAAIRHLIRRIRAAGKAAAILDLDSESYADWLAEGVTMIAVAADAVSLRQMLIDQIAEAREIAGAMSSQQGASSSTPSAHIWA